MSTDRPIVPIAQQSALLMFTGATVANAVYGKQVLEVTPLPHAIAERPIEGVFVSLKRKCGLRGCRGSFGHRHPLIESLPEVAAASALDDPRFPPVSPVELPFLDVEIWLLHGFAPVREYGEYRAQAIRVGRDGLVIECDGRKGLLLPSVPLQYGWSERTFLSQLCRKAELPPTAWKKPAAKLTRFEGDVYRGRLLTPDQCDQLPPPEPRFSPIEIRQLADSLQSWIKEKLATGHELDFSLPEGSGIHGVIAETRLPRESETRKYFQLSMIEAMRLDECLTEIGARIAVDLVGRSAVSPDKIELSMLDDPAVHGSLAELDLDGFDPQRRGLVLIGARQVAVVFDPSHSADEVFASARKRIRVYSHEATRVFSTSVYSTTQVVELVNAPRADADVTDRPAIWAGKFYPAQPQKIASMIDGWVPRRQSKAPWAAALVPHAAWQYSGRLAANVLSRIDFPARVIVLAPKHTRKGVEWAIAPYERWHIPGGQMTGDPEMAEMLADSVDLLQIDAAAHAEEHAIEVQLPFLAHFAPQCRVTGIVMGAADRRACEELARGIAKVASQLDDLPLLLISSDRNHYADDEETRRLDSIAINALRTGDPDTVWSAVHDNQISMCGVAPAVVALRATSLLRRLCRIETVGYATSADVTGDPSRVVGYAGMLFGDRRG